MFWFLVYGFLVFCDTRYSKTWHRELCEAPNQTEDIMLSERIDGDLISAQKNKDSVKGLNLTAS